MGSCLFNFIVILFSVAGLVLVVGAICALVAAARADKIFEEFFNNNKLP